MVASSPGAESAAVGSDSLQTFCQFMSPLVSPKFARLSERSFSFSLKECHLPTWGGRTLARAEWNGVQEEAGSTATEQDRMGEDDANSCLERSTVSKESARQPRTVPDCPVPLKANS